MMEMIDGHTRTCGLIGNPVEHTLSPLIHNTLAELLSHPLVYVPFHVEDENVHKAVEGAYALNVLGLNVTVPHKSRVMKSLVQVDELAEKIGAVNTLVRFGNGFKGYNTDMPGLYRAFLSEGIMLDGQEVVILGAGGAARAVAFLCASKNVKKVYLMNRSADKAAEVAKEVNSNTAATQAQVDTAAKALQNAIKALKAAATAVKPGTPSSVKAVWAGAKKVKITWKKASKADKYIVYRSSKKSSGYKKVGETKGTSLTDKNALTGKTSYIK